MSDRELTIAKGILVVRSLLDATSGQQAEDLIVNFTDELEDFIKVLEGK